MIRFALWVGLLALGCAGTVDGSEEPPRSRPTDVVAETVLPVAAPVAETADPGHQEATEAAPEPTPDVAEPAPNVAPVAPNAAPAAQEPTPPVANEPPAPGCVAVDGGWVCEHECVPSWPIPSAVVDGHLDGYTEDGRQLCGGKVSDGCGHTATLATSCTGDDVCGGEGAGEDGAPDQERFICAECRVDTDPVVAAVRIDASHPVVLAGCQMQPGCISLEVQGSDGRFRSYQFCVAVPYALR